MRGRGACFVAESMPSDACRALPAPTRGRMPAAGQASHCPSSGFHASGPFDPGGGAGARPGASV